MPKVWVIAAYEEYLIGVSAPNQGAAVSLLHDKKCLIEDTYWRGNTLLERFGPDYADEVAALSKEDFFDLMDQISVDIVESDFYGKLP